jgi:hypothetical protein
VRVVGSNRIEVLFEFREEGCGSRQGGGERLEAEVVGTERPLGLRTEDVADGYSEKFLVIPPAIGRTEAAVSDAPAIAARVEELVDEDLIGSRAGALITGHATGSPGLRFKGDNGVCSLAGALNAVGFLFRQTHFSRSSRLCRIDVVPVLRSRLGGNIDPDLFSLNSSGANSGGLISTRLGRATVISHMTHEAV